MRDFPMIRSLKAAIVLTVLFLLPLLLFSGEQVTALYGLMLAITVSPVLICVTALWGGSLPALVGAVSAVLMALIPFGAKAGLLMALYLLPFLAAFATVVARRVDFFKAVLIMAGVYLLSGAAVLLILQNQTEGTLYRSGAEWIVRLINDSGMGDEILISLVQSGLIGLDSSLTLRAQSLFGGLTGLGRSELSLSLTSLMEDMLGRAPVMLVSCSIWFSVLGLGLALYIGRISEQRRAFIGGRREELRAALAKQREAIERGGENASIQLDGGREYAEKLKQAENEIPEGFPDLHMPSFSQWHLPRKVGLMAAIPALGYLPGLFSANAAAQTVGGMLASVFSVVYTIQGMAAFDFAQKKTGRSRFSRCMFLGVLTLLFSRIFLILGVIDQAVDFRKLRPKLGEGDNGEV